MRSSSNEAASFLALYFMPKNPRADSVNKGKSRPTQQKKAGRNQGHSLTLRIYQHKQFDNQQLANTRPYLMGAMLLRFYSVAVSTWDFDNIKIISSRIPGSSPGRT